MLVLIVVWGISAWSFFPAQQARLIETAGIEFAPIVLSLNASFMFLGFSLGAVVGSVTLAHGAVRNLGWVGAAWVIAALLLTVVIARPVTRRSPVQITNGAGLGALARQSISFAKENP